MCYPRLIFFAFILFFLPNIFASGKNTIFFQDTTYRIKKVVIDAGHGGKDSGCLGKHSQEKNITLKIALLVGRKIKTAYPTIEVIYTRDRDVFIPLDERASIANRNKADLFISIHCNFIPAAAKHHGSETYVLGANRKRENLEVAKRENAVVLLEDGYEKRYKGYDQNAPEINILLSAVQSSYIERSMLLADLVEKNLKDNAGRKSHGVKEAGFLVLRETTMPSILVETGFLSNKDEENFLLSADGQNQEAKAVFDAFVTYKNTFEKNKNNAPIAYESVSIAADDPILTTQVATTPVVREMPNNKEKKAVAKGVSRKEEVKPTVVKEKIVSQSAVVFKVQFMKSIFKLSEKDQRFSGIEKVEITEEGTQYVYRADNFATYEAAAAACNQLKMNGFKDAFIVAFEGQKKISVKEAMEKMK
jgi:N-acetylmuramoyl-L-alanine amidase